MPALDKPSRFETIEFQGGCAKKVGAVDVLVVGGGPAGMGAAAGAAQAGAGVVLVERYGFLGGSATAALVNPMSSFLTHGPPVTQIVKPLLFPRDHGEGKPVIAGVLRSFLDILLEKSGCLGPLPATGYTVPFDPEIYKIAAMKLVDNAGVKVLLHAYAAGIRRERDGWTVFFTTKSGYIAIEAASVCDCTGDGDVAVAAGAGFDKGREDGLMQPATLYFRLGNLSLREFGKYVESHPDEWNGVEGLGPLMRLAEEREGFVFPKENILFFGSPYDNEVFVNSTRINSVDGTDAFDLTAAEYEGRRQMETILDFMRKYLPGFENARIIQSGPQVCIRETRRIQGLYTLTEEDLFNARPFEDVIALGAYPIDIHNPAGKGTVVKNIPHGTAYQIPLRSLIPAGLSRMAVAGRCISGSHTAHSSYRVIPVAFATGHAAGVTAALASGIGVPIEAVKASEVQKELRRQGAILDPPCAITS